MRMGIMTKRFVDRGVNEVEECAEAGLSKGRVTH